MRLFTAIDISSETKAKLRKLVDRFRALADLRWSAVENLHITTKFIGECPDERLGEVIAAVEAVAKPGPIEIAIRGLGWFPNPHRPRVFWAGVEAGDGLRTLAANTEKAVAALGVATEDRPFSPHLTLARTRDSLSKESLGSLLRAVAAEEDPNFGAFTAYAQYLYLSAGGKYTKLQEFKLTQS